MAVIMEPWGGWGRPLAIIMPAYLLRAVTILDVYRDMPEQGWVTQGRFLNGESLLSGLFKPERHPATSLAARSNTLA